MNKGLPQQRRTVASILKEIRGTRQILFQTENHNILSALNKLSLDKIETKANFKKENAPYVAAVEKSITVTKKQ